jgi:hypothetical protein
MKTGGYFDVNPFKDNFTSAAKFFIEYFCENVMDQVRNAQSCFSLNVAAQKFRQAERHYIIKHHCFVGSTRIYAIRSKPFS